MPLLQLCPFKYVKYIKTIASFLLFSLLSSEHLSLVEAFSLISENAQVLESGTILRGLRITFGAPKSF